MPKFFLSFSILYYIFIKYFFKVTAEVYHFIPDVVKLNCEKICFLEEWGKLLKLAFIALHYLST